MFLTIKQILSPGASVLAPPEPTDGELLRHAAEVLLLGAEDTGQEELGDRVGDVSVHVRGDELCGVT